MKILRFGPLLAVAGAACLGAAGLVAWMPHGHPPPPPPKAALSEADLAILDQKVVRLINSDDALFGIGYLL